jgi:predicted nucleotidyltransferase component of viral defense system
MIDVLELRERARELSLREDIVEKDYVLGWFLWAIASEPALADTWVFKGGTCLKKCYFETYRFSEDLDFTLIEGAPAEPDALREIFAGLADRLYEASGIEVPRGQVRFERYRNPRGGESIQGRLYYRGPRRPGGDLPRVKLDLTVNEMVVYPPIRRGIDHPYSDGFPTDAQPLCYNMPELFGEKLRALAERCLPRDLYDVVNVFRRPDARGAAEVVREVLKEKCRFKEIPLPTFAMFEAAPRRHEVEPAWEQMLGHQLPALPPIQGYVDGLRELFAWLEGEIIPAVTLRTPRLERNIDREWRPPERLVGLGGFAPLDTIRFAATNRLCVDLGYQGSVRRIEPYSLRRTQDGNLVLYGVKRTTREDRSYRVDRIESVRVTQESFVPVYPVEFWPTGSITAPPVARPSSPWREPTPRPRTPPRGQATGTRYVVECIYCTRRFTRRDTTLKKHKTKDQSYDCPGRSGIIIRIAD